jgi:hypothetical protein
MARLVRQAERTVLKHVLYELMDILDCVIQFVKRAGAVACAPPRDSTAFNPYA